MENVRLGNRWRMRVGPGGGRGWPRPRPPGGKRLLPPPGRKAARPQMLSSALRSGRWAAGWGQGGGAAAFLWRAKEGEVEEEGREGEAEEALTTLRL